MGSDPSESRLRGVSHGPASLGISLEDLPGGGGHGRRLTSLWGLLLSEAAEEATGASIASRCDAPCAGRLPCAQCDCTNGGFSHQQRRMPPVKAKAATGVSNATRTDKCRH